MTPADDINGIPASSEVERMPEKTPASGRRMVGPESEARGGSEAPDVTLDEAVPANGPLDQAKTERDKA